MRYHGSPRSCSCTDHVSLLRRSRENLWVEVKIDGERKMEPWRRDATWTWGSHGKHKKHLQVLELETWRKRTLLTPYMSMVCGGTVHTCTHYMYTMQHKQGSTCPITDRAQWEITDFWVRGSKPHLGKNHEQRCFIISMRPHFKPHFLGRIFHGLVTSEHPFYFWAISCQRTRATTVYCVFWSSIPELRSDRTTCIHTCNIYCVPLAQECALL